MPTDLYKLLVPSLISRAQLQMLYVERQHHPSASFVPAYPGPSISNSAGGTVPRDQREELGKRLDDVTSPKDKVVDSQLKVVHDT